MTEIVIPALRSKQGDQEFYQCQLPVSKALRLVALTDSQVSVVERAQRSLSPRRGNAFAGYLNISTSYICPQIIGNIKTDDLKFIPMSEDNPKIGTLKLPLDSTIDILDGQHRIEGLRKATQNNPELNSDDIAFSLYLNLTLEECQQFFSDINAHQQPVAKSLSQIYDTGNPLSMLTREIVKESWLDEYVELEKGLPTRDKIFTFSQVLKFVKSVREGLTDLDFSEEQVKPTLLKYISEFLEVVKPYREVFDGDITVKDLRCDTIAGTGAFLMAMGNLIVEIENEKNDLRISDLEKLDGVDFGRDAETWQGILIDPSGKILRGAATIKAVTEVLFEELK